MLDHPAGLGMAVMRRAQAPATVVWTRAGKVNFMDHMRDGKRVRRDWHDEAGAVCKVELMNAAKKTELARYLRRDGSCYMEEIMDAATGKVRGSW